MPFGLQPEGFIPKTIADVRSALRVAWRSVFGVAVNVDPRSRNGQEIDIFSAALAEVWAIGEGIYHALEPGGAGGVQLDNLASLSGLTRKPATSTELLNGLVLTGDLATVIPIGSVVSIVGLGHQFETTTAGLLALAIDYGALIGDGDPVLAGEFYWRNDGGTDRVYRVMVSGNVGTPFQVPSGTGTAIPVGTAVFAYMGDGQAYDEVSAEAINTGPINAFAFTLNQIETVIAGWDGANNPADHTTLGTNLETDAELRLRREVSVANPGISPLDDVRAEVLELQSVTECVVFENATDATVGNLPPHSIEVLVEGGVDQSIRDAIFRSKTGGGETIGTTSGSSIDSHGDSHTIKFSRPDLVAIWVEVTLLKDPNVYPTDGNDQVKAALVLKGDALGLGRDVVSSQLKAIIFAEVPGILDVTPVFIGTAPAPVSEATVVLSLRQRADLDTARIIVTATNGTP